MYQRNATVYVAGRREETAQRAIDDLKSAHPESRGRLEFLPLDLSDLSTIKASVDKFLAKEERLDVLWNNAGVMGTPSTVKTKQVQ